MLFPPKRLFRPAADARRTMCLAYVGALVFGVGCSLRHGDYALEGSLRIELSPPTGSLFHGVEVKQCGDELFVSGFGERPMARGHVEITIMGPDRAVLTSVRTEPLPPLAVPKRSHNYRFQTSLPIVPPAGSTLRVTYVLPAGASGR